MSLISYNAPTVVRRGTVRPMPAAPTPESPAPSPLAPGVWSRTPTRSATILGRGPGRTPLATRHAEARAGYQEAQRIYRERGGILAGNNPFPLGYASVLLGGPQRYSQSVGVARSSSGGSSGGGGDLIVEPPLQEMFAQESGGDEGMASPQSWVLLLAVAAAAWFLLKG